LEESIDKTLEAVQATEFSGYLSGEKNFRYEIFPEYKKSRKDQVRPRHLTDLKLYLREKYNAQSVDGLEADDLLGIEQSTHSNTIICGLDKDLLQVPGKHYTFEISGVSSKGERWVRPEQFFDISPEEGLLRLYTQILTGDSTDGIKGASGIGAVKAERLLRDATTEDEMIRICSDQFSSDEEFIMNARCVYVWRKQNDDWKERFDRCIGGT
jgi:DNA polymerase-1